MKKFIIFCLLLFSLELLNAQSYFSKRYQSSEITAGFSYDIIEEPMGYSLSFMGYGPLSPNLLLGFYKIDSIGNAIGSPKILSDPILHLQTGYPGSFTKNKLGEGYSCIGTKMKMVPNGRYDRGWLLRLDNSLDTLWTKSYIDDFPNDSSIMFWNFRELNDGAFIVTGLFNPISGGICKTGLFKIDSVGNLIWKRKYGDGYVNLSPFDVSATTDHGYVIAAYYEPVDGGSSQGTDPIIIKTDSIGNQIWTLHLGSPYCMDTYAFVDVALDGNIQVGTAYSDTCWLFDFFRARINFVKIGNDRSIIWDKKYGYPKNNLGLLKVRVLPDGDVLGTGWYYYPKNGPTVVGWILRTDSAGNEKWYREYSLLKGSNSFNELWNAILTRDGGFAACGSVFPVAPDTGSKVPWILKVDSLGCENPGQCWVGLNEISVKTFTPDKPFVVYPNPASDNLTIEFHINTEGAEIELCDLFGKTHQATTIPPDKERQDIDISRLNSGIWLLKIRSGDRIYPVEKIIIQH